MKISLIAAVAENGIIGKDGGIPWHLPDDLKHFKNLTTGHAIIMGRKTFESIGQALPRRDNLVLTRSGNIDAPGCVVLSSLDAALAWCRDHGESEAFVIGGEQLYRDALRIADRVYLTKVHGNFGGDTFFPVGGLASFAEVEREYVGGDLPHSFIRYERRRP